jgi:uncharacterized membrane protein YcaP (DUF421 family)
MVHWFRFDIAPAELLLRSAVIYLAVLLFIRLSGKKQMGQMGPTEFVALLLLSNAVQNAMTGGDNSLMGGLLSAALLIVASRLISYGTFKSATLRAWFEGTPTVLIQNGAVIQANLDRELLTRGELVNLLRKQGVETVAEVYIAVLAPDGSLSVARHAGDLSPLPQDQGSLRATSSPPSGAP